MTYGSKLQILSKFWNKLQTSKFQWTGCCVTLSRYPTGETANGLRSFVN